MTRPTPITTVLLLVGAASLLAFTVMEQLRKPEEFGTKASLSKNNINPAALPVFSSKKNPAHGQPGHQCGIAVGAPLPSVTQSTAGSPAFASLSLPNNISSNSQADLLNLSKSTTLSSSALEDVQSAAINPAHGKPGHRCDIPVGAPLSSTPAPESAVNSAAAPKNNPAHGQPYHRCDIAVGAPLSSPPAKSAVNNSASPAPKLNPAHGQPFHRCDIAVGAPLNSKTNTSSAPSPLVNSPLVKPDSLTAPIYTFDSSGARLNPPHGKPGHDCSVPVGKPLK